MRLSPRSSSPKPGPRAKTAELFQRAQSEADRVVRARSAMSVAEDLRKLEKATVHYGRYVETFVGNLYEADQQGKALECVSAIAMEEKVLLDYNQGELLGNPTLSDR